VARVRRGRGVGERGERHEGVVVEALVRPVEHRGLVEGALARVQAEDALVAAQEDGEGEEPEEEDEEQEADFAGEEGGHAGGHVCWKRIGETSEKGLENLEQVATVPAK